MKVSLFGILVFSAFASCQAQYKLRFELKPAATTGKEFFIAGSFNNWNPADQQYKFQYTDGAYTLNVNLPAGQYQFKVTRGSWSAVECAQDGTDTGNRIINITSDTSFVIVTANWKDLVAAPAKKSTAGNSVHIIDTAFYIPQLERSRRIWVYLPGDYESSKKKYPVLYMHDGQNVFEDSSSYSGEWGVDEALDSLGIRSGECIVVAIDNGRDKRLNEYCPYDFSLTGIAADYRSNKGEGKLYTDFIVKTLKPYIDKQYRTIHKRKDTFIAGSSMGGLISMYAIIAYPKVFGAAGVFSPAFWVGPSIFNDIRSHGRKVKGKIFFYAGMQESESMVPDMLKAFEEMKKVSKARMKVVIRAEGLHNETRWRAEFPGFYQWMMAR